jgi:predicted nuclease with TOPRIM domain
MEEQLMADQITILQKTQTIDQIQEHLQQTQQNLKTKNKELVDGQNLMIKLQMELQNKVEEMEAMNIDLETRNNILKEMEKQLTERQMIAAEKTRITEADSRLFCSERYEIRISEIFSLRLLFPGSNVCGDGICTFTRTSRF